MLRLSRAALIVAALGGCASGAPRLHRPDRLETYCGDRAAVVTAIESIVSSTSDAPESAPVPSPRAIRRGVESNGGIIAHWDAQQVYLPAVAATLGATSGYVTLGDAAISDGASGEYRRIYLTVKIPAGVKTFALHAYDVQAVCTEGKLSS